MSAKSPHPTRLLVTATVGFYLIAALAMVIANKWVLNTTTTPLFFIFAQLLIAVVLFLLSHALGFLVLPFDFNPQLIRGLAPMVMLNVFSLSFSNFTLKYVDASFYQVARGLVLPFTVFTSFVMLSSRPSKLILASCVVVTIGFFIGVCLDGVQVSMTGVTFGVISSAVAAVHSVFIKKSLDLVNGNALHLGWYSNLLSSIAIIFLFLAVGEGPDVLRLVSGTADDMRSFLVGSLITGTIGFLMCIASMLSIQVTSPITHMISSAVRGVVVSFLGVWIFHDVITTGRASSIAIILLGSIMYTWIKHLESQQNRPVSPRDKYDRLPMEEVDLESEKRLAGKEND